MQTTIRSKYGIWDNGILVPAFKRRIQDKRCVPLTVTNAQEREIGLKYYMPGVCRTY